MAGRVHPAGEVKMPKFFEVKEKDAPAFCAAMLVLLTAVIIFSKISFNGLPSFDDAYYGQKAKEMMTAHDPWVVHYGGAPAYDNPPMHFWIMSLAFKVFGVNEFGARFSSAVFVLLIIILGYRMAALAFRDEWAGFFAAAALVTTNFLIRHAFRGMLDVTLVFFEMLSLYLFMLGLRNKGLYFWLLAGIFTGFAVLTKSLMGFYPLAAAGLYLIITGQWKTLVSARFAVFILAALIVSAPWYVINYMDGGANFINFHFNDIIGGAAAAKGIKFTPEYLKVVFSYGLPWMPMALFGAYEMTRREWEKRGENLFMLFIIFAWLIVAALSFTSTVKSWYIMPAFAGCSLISGYLLYIWIKPKEKFALVSVAVYAVIALVLVILPLDLNSRKSNDIKALAPFVKALVPEGKSLVNYRVSFWVLQNALLFYTDRGSSPVIEDPKVLMSELDKGGIAISHADKYDSDLKDYQKDFTVIARAGDKVLFCKKGMIEGLSSPVFILNKP
jgi:4-amino-4-deoxy-L-arabinose transferase-like glycosyltransferase